MQRRIIDRSLAGIALALLLGLPGLLGGTAASPAAAQAAPVAAGGEGTGAPRAEHFDPEKATEAYLARLSPAQRAKSDAYFEGGYWITLWSFLYGLGIAWLLLGTRLSARMRDLAERLTRLRPLQTFLYVVQYVLVTALLGFPWAVYTDFVREHQYGMATQDFPAWLLDQLKGLALGLVLGGLALTLLYAVLRWKPRTWWIWGAVVSVLIGVALIALGPVFIEPVFNNYTELKDPALREPILSLARANGIETKHVYVVDASRQTKRVSANVAGMFGSMRIALNDNLLRRVSPAGIKAVMGHEMGHYVLDHAYKAILYLIIVLVTGFAFLKWAFERLVARRGERWGIRGVADPAGLPLLAAILAVFFFVLTPVNNTFIRTDEAEADIFGLNAAREPDGAAEVALMLSEYRKISPGPVEEWIFFDHPSGRNRILMAMRWKAEHLGDVKGQ
ncbi:MAG TPA: M48 family metallopeptidase [Thermoanaerobaculia bacterium]|jgi:STE24 endopeptidase|nr:M48 family metallopeptidase [Thermoanaerobaculia bacterium]